MYSEKNSGNGDFYRQRDEAIRRMREMAEGVKDSSRRPPPNYSGVMHSPGGKEDGGEAKHYESAAPAETEAEHAFAETGDRPSLKLLERIKGDDILLIGLFILLFNEDKKDDYLMLLVLAMLFFT